MKAIDSTPQYPLYVVSKGRYEYMMTSKALTKMGVQHYIIVEPDEVDSYQKAVDHLGLLTDVLPLDMSYKDKYDTCGTYGAATSTGAGPARNFAWDHALSNGHAWHWEMDDNIRAFRRLNKNEKVKVTTGAIFRAMEDFSGRYENVAMAGPNYFMFASARTKLPAYVANTRIYSCNLIRGDIPFRWRGRYNEDTILSLDILKEGWCTIQFNAFLQEKMPTQQMKGGNTDALYHADGVTEDGQVYATGGTTPKTQMLIDLHPDVARMVWRFKRVHHHVDYSSFKANKLIKRKDLPEFDKINNYGMRLKGKEE